MNATRFSYIVMLMLASATATAAAPFCVVTGYGTKNCYYYSQRDCARDAQSQNGMCVVNDQRQQSPSYSRAPFCVVSAYGSQCHYYDVNQCRRDAQSADGTCVVNSNR